MPGLALVGLFRRRPENFHADDAAGEIEIQVCSRTNYSIAILAGDINKYARRDVIDSLMAAKERERVIVATGFWQLKGEIGQITVFVH